MEEDLHVEVNVAGRPSNYHQNPISWPMQCRVPDPNPAFSFQLPASSFVLVQLPAFCQRLFAKLIPKKVSQTCDLKQSVPARLEQPTNQPPFSSFTLPPSPTYKRTVPLPFFVLQLLLPQLLFAQRAVAATSALLSSAQLGQHTICDNSFLRINICSACVPVLLGPPLFPPLLPLSLSL